MKRGTIQALVCMLVVLLAVTALGVGCTGVPVSTSAPQDWQEGQKPEPAEDESPPPLERGELRSIGGWMGDIANPRGFFRTEMVGSNEYSNLMFYDYKTMQQRYYCNEEGCAHNEAPCQSYMPHGGNAYLYGDTMFVYYDYFGDGTSLLGIRGEDGITQVLLRRGEFEMQLSALYCDGASLYFMDWDSLMCLDIESGQVSVLYSRETPFVDTETGQEYPPMEYCMPLEFAFEGKIPLELYDAEVGRHLILVSPEGEITVACSWQGDDRWYRWYPGGVGYAVESETGHIYSYSLATGQETMVTDAFAFGNKMIGPDMGWEEDSWYPAASLWYVQPVGDWLMLHLAEVVSTYSTREWAYLYHPETGEVREFGLGDYWFGYTHNLQVWGETPYGLLVTEDTREIVVSSHGPDGVPYQFDSVYWVYALMDLEDFVNSNPAFNTIQPVEYKTS